MNDTLAVITLDLTQKNVKQITITQKQYQFKCKRCAKLCCKLGGPPLTQNDVKQIEQAGYSVEDFLDHTNNNYPNTAGNLKNNKDGACIFLKFDPKQNVHKCNIYNARPTLCRIYPFKFEKIQPDKVAVKIIPCCMGLNNPEAKPLDKDFVSNQLIQPLLEATELL